MATRSPDSRRDQGCSGGTIRAHRLVRLPRQGRRGFPIERRRKVEWSSRPQLAHDLRVRASSEKRDLGEADEIQRLGAAIAKLKPEERDMLRWHYWDGLKIGQIAALLDLNYSTAAKRLFRLVKRLEAELELT